VVLSNAHQKFYGEDNHVILAIIPIMLWFRDCAL
jgi:hypothetical protein